MRRTVLGLVVLASVVVVAAGCGTEPAPQGPPPAPPAAPTAAVGADGQPITSLCDLLSGQDFAEMTGQAGTPPSATGATSTSATCDYGGNRTVRIEVGGSPEAATSAYQAAVKAGGFTPVKQDAMAGVDESAYGTAAGSGVLNMRRRQLVVSISLPGADNEINLVKLAAVLLARANALGA